ncbi:thioredoxin family protein [Chloroflexia bacterium SDU3-3]|nr:thioredoxin family protein [Chloroflexia bacterium SDU3-3]
MVPALFDQRRNPFHDLRDALTQARKEHKNVLVTIGGDWCIWCHRLEAFIRANPELQALRDRYVLVNVFISESNAEINADFLTHVPELDGVPHLVVYNGHGYLLCSQPTDPLEDGDTYSYERVRDFLETWSDWRRSIFDDLDTSELKQRFEQHLGPGKRNKLTLSA